MHLGVTGEDLIRETLADVDGSVEFLKPLGFGRADVVVAVPDCWIDVARMADLEDVAAQFAGVHGRRLRVATKYMNLTRRFFAGHGVAGYRIVESVGATEATPAAGTAELIVDITTTGTTLRANHLKVLEDGLILQVAGASLRLARGALDRKHRQAPRRHPCQAFLAMTRVHREVNGEDATERLMSRAMKLRTILAALLLAACAQTALAAPARIIILRHGEKADKWKLCEIGQQRADALALNYLGKGAAKSLFTEGNDPAFFFAITLHTLELASPAAASWSKPLILYSVVPEKGADDDEDGRDAQPPHPGSREQHHAEPGPERQDGGDGVGAQAHRQ